MPDVWLYSGEANPTDVRLTDPTVQRSQAITGTGDVTALAGSIAVAGLETFVASTGDVTAAAGAIAGVALETFASTGALAAAAGTIAGTGLETFASTGDLTAAAGSIAVAGLETFASTGNVTAAAGAIAIAGLETFVASGDVTAAAGSLDGLGDVGVLSDDRTGTGACTAAAGSIDAIGDVPIVEVLVAIADPAPAVFASGDWAGPMVRRPKTPRAISGRGSCTARAGQVQGRGSVSTARIDDDEAVLLGLLDLEECAA